MAKYIVQTTGTKAHEYNSKEQALKVYNNIRALYMRLGYKLVDAGDLGEAMCELWINGDRERNLEFYPAEA